MQPPAELEKQCAEINNEWLPDFSYTILPELANGTGGKEWRLAIVTKGGVKVIENLIPANTDGFAVHTILKAIDNAYSRGLKDGRLGAVRSLVIKQCHMLSISVTDLKEAL
jgi:hypothetical protein